MISQRVVGNPSCRKVRHQLVVLELIQRETVSRLVVVLIPFHVCNDSTVYLKLDVPDVIGRFLVLVHLFKLQSGDTSRRDDFRSQHIRHHRDDGCRNHVGEHHSFKAHARREHGNDFGVLRQLRGKENHGDEDEERTEQIRIIRNEVQVIVKYDSLQRSLIVDEMVDILIYIEYHRNGDNQCDSEEISSQKLDDDIPVKSLQPFGFEKLFVHVSGVLITVG